MEVKSQKIKIGTITLALGLVLLGIGMLLYNFGGIKSPETVWRLWPLLLIGLGVEYFVRRAGRGEKEIEFSVPSVILIGIFILAGITVNAVSNAIHGLGIGGLMDHVSFGNNHSHVREWQSEPIAVDNGSTLDIDNIMGEVNLEPSPDGKLHVSARITGRADNDAEAKAVADAARVVTEKGQVTRIYIDSGEGPAQNNRISADMKIQVPPDLEIKVENKMGRITSQDIKANLDLSSDMGEINVERLQGDLKAYSKMGSVNAIKVTGKTDLNTNMGRINIQEPGADVTANTRMGEIELVSGNPLEKSYTLNTTNGRILFRLPEDSNLTVEAKATHGRISGIRGSEDRVQSVNNNTGKMVLNGGKGSARLTTSNGSIEVETY